MTSSTIGTTSLTISTILYSFWLIPQIHHNARHNALANMSFMMHVVLMIGCVTDLHYALSLNMPFCYVWVSALSLTLIMVQHIQWYKQPLEKTTLVFFWLLTGATCSLITLALINIHCHISPRGLNITCGWIANLSFLLYPIPQILKQYRYQSATSISITFILLSLLLSIADLISALTLSWATPSLIGPLALITCHCTLLSQHYCYHYKKKMTYEKSTYYC